MNLYKSVNGFFYYLRKIPFWENTSLTPFINLMALKRLFFDFGHFSDSLRVFGKFLWLAVYVFLGNLGINLVQVRSSLWTWNPQAFLLGFLLWVVVVGMTFHCGKAMERVIARTGLCAKFFGLSWTTYLQKQALVKPILITLFYIPALVTFGFLAGNFWYFLVGLTAILSNT